MAEDQKTDKTSTNTAINAAQLTFFGTVIAALISAAVSWAVSSYKFELDVEKFRASHEIDRATLFKELMQDATKGQNAAYAVLALWKLYDKPEERRLVIITALQSEDENAIHVLHLLGLEKELESYKSTIRNVLENAPEDKKARLSELYAEIDPLGVLQINLRKIEDLLEEEFRVTPEMHRFCQIVAGDRAIQKELKVQFDDGFDSWSDERRLVVGLCLYAAQDRDPLDRVISAIDVSADVDTFVALITEGLKITRFELPERERLMQIALTHLKAGAGPDGNLAVYRNWLEALRQVPADARMSSEDQQTVGQIIVEQLKLHPQERFLQTGSIKALARFDRRRAERIYTLILACADEDVARDFYTLTPAHHVLFKVDPRAELTEERENRKRILLEMSGSCREWTG